MKRKEEPLNKVNQFETLEACLEYIKNAYPEQTALTFYDEDGTESFYTYEQFANDVERCMKALQKKKLDGRHIALVSENRYEWVVIFWAVTCLGGVVVAIDIEQNEEDIYDMVIYSDARAVFVSSEFAVILEPLRRKMPFIVLGNQEQDMLGYEEFLEDASKWNLDRSGLHPDPERPAAIVFTSGTTSTAKPVILSQRNLMYNSCQAMAMVEVGEKVFCPLPLYHTYALSCGLLGCMSQGLHFSANGTLKTLMRDIRVFEPDTILSVPLITDSLLKAIHLQEQKEGIRDQVFYNMQKEKRRKKWHLRARTERNGCVDLVVGKRLARIISGGAHMNDKSAEEMEFYGIQVLQGYGITECSPLISVNRNSGNRFLSVGKVIPGTELKFVGGEILVKGPSVFKGYYKSDSMTREVLVHGWFHTGDIGYMDKQGYLYICGRKKSLIVFSNGKKVVPEELEKLLTEIPMIKEVMVYGAKSGQAEDEVTLSAMIYVDRERTKDMTSFEILECIQEEVNELNKTLPFYKRIQSMKLTEAEFGKTGIRKIKRNEGSV